MWITAAERLEPSANTLFARLPERARAQLSPSLEYVSLTRNQSVYAAGDFTTAVLFPLTTVLAVLNQSRDGATTMLALVGREGLVGLPAAFTSGKTLNLSLVVCIPGIAVRLSSAHLKAVFNGDSQVRQMVLDYMQSCAVEMMETAHCSRHHTSIQQLSVLILRATARHRREVLTLTHDQMGSILGVRRETISVAAHLLQDRNILRYSRGSMAILDRAALERVACDCYDLASSPCEEAAGDRPRDIPYEPV